MKFIVTVICACICGVSAGVVVTIMGDTPSDAAAIVVASVFMLTHVKDDIK